MNEGKEEARASGRKGLKGMKVGEKEQTTVTICRRKLRKRRGREGRKNEAPETVKAGKDEGGREKEQEDQRATVNEMQEPNGKG